MNNYYDTIREELRQALAQSAIGYLRSGIELFHKEEDSDYNPSIQAPVGNLVIAVELMIKTFLAKKCPLLIFKDLPIPLKVLFGSPMDVPKNFNWRRYDVNLRTFSYKTINLDGCISAFYVFYPEQKQTLHPYLKVLTRCRNASIHASLPSFQRYELERMAYLSLQLFKLFNSSTIFTPHYYHISRKDTRFLSYFEKQRSDTVMEKIERAKKKAQTLNQESSSLANDDWECYVTQCPICKSDALLEGYTEEESNGEEFRIDFYANSFECDACGLGLYDMEELHLAGIDTIYDRTDELGEWLDGIDIY